MIGRLKGRSVRELRDRFVQAAWNEADRMGLVRAPRRHASVDGPPITPWPSPDPMAITSRLGQTEREQIIARADRIMAGSFDVLGLTGLSYGLPVNWQLDPLSGRSAPLVHFTRVPYLDTDVVGDHKLTWEVNRHQWFPQLAQAWLLTQDARYANHAARLLDEWLTANPPKLGINWCSALELAFRMQSWIHGLRLFGNVEAIPPALRSRLLVAIEVHARHVERNLSTWFSPNTHLTGEALALLSVGIAWPDLPDATRWRKLGWHVLRDTLPQQIRRDGVYFEHATWYQAYTVDFCATAITLARYAKLPGWDSLVPCLQRAAKALRDVIRPDGTIARLGDDDGGSLFTFRMPAVGDLSDSLWRASAALDDPALLPARAAGCSTLLWLEGSATYDRLRAQHNPAPLPSVAHREGGWVVLREKNDHHVRAAQEHCLIVDTIPHGRPFFGHSHAAALAIDLSVHGVSMLVDPGTAAYVGDARRHFRGTAAHNTVTIDNLDSSEQAAPFKWARVAESQLTGFSAAREAQWVSATHDGYQRLADPVRHDRTILRLARHYWLMFDTLTAAGAHRAVLTFQAAIGAEIEIPPAATPRVLASGVTLLVATDPRLATTVETRGVSPAYALQVPAQALVCHGRTAGITTFCTVLAAADECGALHVAQDGQRWLITHARGTDVVASPRGAKITIGPATFDGNVLVHMRVDAHETVIVAGTGVLELGQHSIRLEADDIRIAHRTADGSWSLQP